MKSVQNYLKRLYMYHMVEKPNFSGIFAGFLAPRGEGGGDDNTSELSDGKANQKTKYQQMSDALKGPTHEKINKNRLF